MKSKAAYKITSLFNALSALGGSSFAVRVLFSSIIRSVIIVTQPFALSRPIF
jgi:hypothetical protein